MDQSQVTQLLMRQRTTLYAYIFAAVRNHADAEDIFQNVSLAVIGSYGQLKDETGFVPWSLEIARRRVLEHRRHGAREEPLDPLLLTQLAEAAGRVEHAQPAAAHHTALRTCLENLPAESRRVMQLRYDASVSDMAALAALVGRSVQSVYAQIKRIKLALRECVTRRLSAEA